MAESQLDAAQAMTRREIFEQDGFVVVSGFCVTRELDDIEAELNSLNLTQENNE